MPAGALLSTGYALLAEMHSDKTFAELDEMLDRTLDPEEEPDTADQLARIRALGGQVG